MKKLALAGGIAILASALAQNLQATLVTGAIGFGGNVTWDTSSSATATEVTGWLDTQVLSDTGSFASFITPIAPATFTTTTWNLNDPSTIIPSFWTAGGFTFNLDSSVIVAQGGIPGTNAFVIVNGTGTVSGNGFAPTTLSWIFNSQDPQSGNNPPQWTFSASAISSTNVPDGGATVTLLGLALSSLALLKRKWTA